MVGSRPLRRIPTRSCVACRTARPKADLVRVVRTPAGSVTLDESGRMAGRGAYLCRNATCWRAAVTKGQVTRALDVQLPADLRALLEAGPTTNTTQPMTINEGGARGQE